jgi:hypothetical protein
MSRLVRCAAVLIAALPVLAPGPATADVLCDPSFQDCRATLLALVRNETERLDVAMWFMEDQELADAVVAKFREGVPDLEIDDPRSNSTTPNNAHTL